jgi:hypothetical protein
MRYFVSLALLIATPAAAAPFGLTPGFTDRDRAEALLGAPEEAELPGARYRYRAPSGSNLSKVVLYFSRDGGALEIAELTYAAPQDAATARAALGQKAADLRYTTQAGLTAEIFLAPRAALLIAADGKAVGVRYLSGEALGVIASELAPYKPDRSLPEKALLGFVAALSSGRETEVAASVSAALGARELLKQRAQLLTLFDGFKADLPLTKVKGKQVTIRVRQPLFGAADLTFDLEAAGWVLSKLEIAEERAPAGSPRGAFELWRKDLLAGVGEAKAAEAALGAAWKEKLPALVVVGGFVGEGKAAGEGALLLAGEGRRFIAAAKRDIKLGWRVTDVKEQ